VENRPYSVSEQKQAFSAASFEQYHQRITNVAARFYLLEEPTSSVQKLGYADVSLLIVTKSGCMLRICCYRNSEGLFKLNFIYKSPFQRLLYTNAKFSPATRDYIYLEIDIEVKSSNVVFWLNDQGFDMGFLPGFEQGGDQAIWRPSAFGDEYMIEGKLTECAFATPSGWRKASFNSSSLVMHNIGAHHYVRILSTNSASFGDKRFGARN